MADTDVREFEVVRVVVMELAGVLVPVASPAALIRTKNTCRPQDAIDRAFLEGVLRKRG